jgi:NAD(P)-dependent dehydrogenase (short-subunit alcohol dehydrogenase family)
MVRPGSVLSQLSDTDQGCIAGTTYRNKPTDEVTTAEFDLVFNVNVRSIFMSVQAVIPLMRKQGHGGSIINISSTGSMRPRPGLVWYNASKGAVTNAR